MKLGGVLQNISSCVQLLNYIHYLRIVLQNRKISGDTLKTVFKVQAVVKEWIFTIYSNIKLIL